MTKTSYLLRGLVLRTKTNKMNSFMFKYLKRLKINCRKEKFKYGRKIYRIRWRKI